MATRKREMFDAAEYVERLDLMIAKLRTKKPGEAVGKVGKNEILTMRRYELQQLLNDGYTVNQIAEAMKEDVFSILPKTITEMVKPKSKATGKATSKATGTATSKATETAKGAESAADKSTFTPRKMDLDTL